MGGEISESTEVIQTKIPILNYLVKDRKKQFVLKMNKACTY